MFEHETIAYFSDAWDFPGAAGSLNLYGMSVVEVCMVSEWLPGLRGLIPRELVIEREIK